MCLCFVHVSHEYIAYLKRRYRYSFTEKWKIIWSNLKKKEVESWVLAKADGHPCTQPEYKNDNQLLFIFRIGTNLTVIIYILIRYLDLMELQQLYVEQTVGKCY